MNDKLIKHRVPAHGMHADPVGVVPPVAPPAHEAPAPYHDMFTLIVGPAIGFVLAAMLAISFALALAGGAGQAALGGHPRVQSVRTAVFVL